MGSFPFASSPKTDDSAILRICAAERERQWRQLIMIPSESICHPEAAAVLATELGNIYAEGQPEPVLAPRPREIAGDAPRFQGWETRMADRRFYKGTIGANRAELLAQHKIASVFARLPGSPPAESLCVNVQPLSGAAANLAVYTALLKPGDRMMGLDLSHGGHLTHGSQFNFSGKTYEAHSYGIDPKTRKLDYAQVRRQALEARPRILIGGASSYPWDFDWAALRAIADEAGAYLLADVAHLAGLIAGGALMNPLPHAHVVTFTTHKTLCGPRGAAILCADPELAAKLSMAVFPGLQGGPHMNSIAAIGRLFELIQEDYAGFCAFQRRIVENAQFMAQSFAAEGFALEYGGTDTHMLLVDLKPFPAQGDRPLDGEIAARLLEIAGIVCNKNVLPGDGDAAHASGLRFGLPWLTQRGVTRDQLREIARVAKSVLGSARTFGVWSPQGDLRCRARVPDGVLLDAAQRTRVIAEALPHPAHVAPPPSAEDERQRPQPRAVAPHAAASRCVLRLRGEKDRLALSEIVTARLPLDRRPILTRLCRSDGTTIDEVVVAELDPVGGLPCWALMPHESRAEEVRRWIEALSDGYLLFDPADPNPKMDGPLVVEEIGELELPPRLSEQATRLSGGPECDLTKPYFIGQRALYAQARVQAKAPYRYAPPNLPLRRTVFHPAHVALGAKLAPFAGWEMPIQYPAGIFAEHRAVRTAAGLFDVSHMTALEVGGPRAPAFVECLLANSAARLSVGEAQYSYMLYPDGAAVDDVYVYRLAPDRFMIVVNAANAERVKDWMEAVNSRGVIVDEAMPGKALDGPAAVRDLRDAGEDSRVQVALQGPASRTILQSLAGRAAERAALGRLAMNAFVPVTLAGMPALVTRTGYTGEKTGYEIFVHPSNALSLWGALVETGKPMGLLPAGLGARDSSRVEAGFPLFGHELEGGLKISLTEAGYGFVVRLHKPFFIGRDAYQERARRSQRRVLRLQGQGRKTLRAGHVLLDSVGKPVGQVTSFAYVHPDLTFIVLACVESGFQPAAGQTVLGARLTLDKIAGAVDEQALVSLAVLPRFPDDAERESWPARYDNASPG